MENMEPKTLAEFSEILQIWRTTLYALLKRHKMEPVHIELSKNGKPMRKYYSVAQILGVLGTSRVARDYRQLKSLEAVTKVPESTIRAVCKTMHIETFAKVLCGHIRWCVGRSNYRRLVVELSKGDVCKEVEGNREFGRKQSKETRETIKRARKEHIDRIAGSNLC